MTEKQTQLEEQVALLLGEVQSYNKKQTKVGSARIRKQLGNLKNMVPSIRANLVAADKAGY